MVGDTAAAVIWPVVVLALGGLSLPLCARVFPDPTTRTAFAVPLGLAWLTLGSFWLGRLSLPLAPAASVGVLAALSIALFRRDGLDVPGRPAATAAAVFATGYGIVLGIQAVDPAITATGETYWNFALVQSLLRTATLPPQDPWFAGEPIQYYYGGHLLIATVAELLGTPGREAFALGKAVVSGALFVAAYGVAGGLAAIRDRSPLAAGLFGTFFVGLASNLHPPLTAGLVGLPRSTADRVLGFLGVTGSEPWGWAPFSPIDAAHFAFTSTDFPMYTAFLTGIHPHWVSPPFLLLLVGILGGYWVTPPEAQRRRLGLLGMATPVIGLVAIVNTWSLPTAAGLVGLTVALAPTDPRLLLSEPGGVDSTRREWLERVALGGFASIAVLVIGLAWVAPYYLRGLAGDPGLGLLPARSTVWYFVVGYGGFLLVFAVYLGVEIRNAGLLHRFRLPALVGALALLGFALLASFPGLILVLPVLVGGLALRRHDPTDFLSVLLVAGAGLVLLVEVAYVAESAEPGRINTVYKVYMQVWVLWGPAAGVAAARLAGLGTTPEVRVPAWRPAFCTFVVALLSVYAVVGVVGFASFAVAEGVDPSIDGLGHLEADHPDEAVAIDWLAARPGQPTIASAPVPENRLYTFEAAPAASLTGIPTVLGWNHEADYRGKAAYAARLAAVDRIYSGGPAERARTLREHGVDYIWVGDAERERYCPIDYSREPGISVAFRSGDVTVYAIDRSNLTGES